MKKLFLLLTALAMSFNATMYAVPYLPDAEDAASSYLFDDNGQISGRNNAPMATTNTITLNHSCYTIYTTISALQLSTAKGYQIAYQNSNGSQQIVLQFNLPASNVSQSYDGVTGPPVGSYPVWYSATKNDFSPFTSFSSNTGKCIGQIGYDGLTNGGQSYYYKSVYVTGGRTYNGLKSGTITVADGWQGPYITGSSVKDASGNNVNITLGTPAYTLTLNTNNASYGTVSGGGRKQGNTSATITATPKPGYKFVSWSDGGAQSHSVNMNGNKTLTATFAPTETYTHHFNWTTDLAGHATTTSWYCYPGNYPIWSSIFMAGGSGRPAIQLIMGAPETTQYGATEGPSPGIYGVNWDPSATNQGCNAYGNITSSNGNSSGLNSLYIPSTTSGSKYFYDGELNVQPGRHGYPYYETNFTDQSGDIYKITAGESRDLTMTYNSVIISKDENNKKVVLSASDGNGNHLELLFPNLTTLDAAIGVPAGSYTIGTNVYGCIWDEDGYAKWKLTAGTITINKSGTKVSMSRVVTSDSDLGWSLDLTISSTTPTIQSITNVPIASATVNKNSGYFNVIGAASTTNVRVESAGVDYRTGYFGNYDIDDSYGEDISNNYTNFTYNGSSISLNYNPSQAYISTISGNVFMEAYLWSTSGTIYRIAAFQGAPYTITYKDKGNVAYTGSNVASLPASHIYGSSTTLVDGVRTGYTFDGWYENADCTGSPVTSIGSTAKTANFTLYAKWTPLTYTVTLNANSSYNGKGSNTTAVAVYDSIALRTFTATQAEDGYYVEGYYTAATGSTKVLTAAGDFAGTSVVDNTVSPAVTYITSGKWAKDGTATLYAHMEGNPFTVTFDKNNNRATGTMNIQDFVYGTTENLTANSFELTGYNFAGWNTKSDGTGKTYADELRADTITITKDDIIPLYAQWNATPYSITYNLSGGTNPNTAAISYTIESSDITLPTPTKDGYRFDGWYANSDLTTGGVVTTIPNGSTGIKTFWAKWTPTYTVDFAVDGTNSYGTVSPSSITDVPYGATIVVDDNTITIKDGDEVIGSVVTATPASDAAGYTYAFRDWTNAIATVTDNMEVTANFTRSLIPYTITYNLNDGTNPVSPAPATSYNVETTTITLPTPTKEGYNFLGWYANSDLTTGGVVTTIPVGSYGNKEFWAKWEQKTYTVNIAVDETNNYGTVTAELITEVPHGRTITVSDNAITINSTTVTANPTSPNTAQYAYGFGSWKIGSTTLVGGETVTGTITIKANFTRTTRTYDITWKNEDGTSTLETDNAQAYGTPTAYNGATTPTKTVTGYTYTFDGWATSANGEKAYNNGETPAVSGAATYYAHFTGGLTDYTITYEGLEDATNSNPTSYNIESETITLVAPGERSGYVFTGWTLGGSPITEIVSGSTGNKTLTATWEEMPSEIVLEDNRENSFYDTFKAKYDGAEDVTVVYNRQFPKSKWATLCLPFDVNSALLNSVDMGGRVYEFKKAEGNAETGINLYFATAETIKAGKGYIVNANAKLASKSSFRFPDVKINLESDKGDELNSQASYDALEGTSTDGNIALVGTLRKGRLRGVNGKNRYMGLKDNKIYYPNISTEEGSLILAYRGIFRSIEGTLNAERIRIVVDGEDMGELLIENDGRMTIDNDATRKFVKDGVLYIEREGVIYDAQGKRVESL